MNFYAGRGQNRLSEKTDLYFNNLIFSYDVAFNVLRMALTCNQVVLMRIGLNCYNTKQCKSQFETLKVVCNILSSHARRRQN